MKPLTNTLALIIIMVALVLTPAAVLLIVHYGVTGDLAKFEWLTKLTASWSLIVVLCLLLGSLLAS